MRAWLLLLLVPFAAIADTTFTWTGSTGAEGYYLYIEPTPIAGSPAQHTLVGEATTTFTTALQEGTQYEAWVTAYLTQPEPYESADSNHVRFTPPLPVEVITVPQQPTSLTIQFGAPQ